MLALHWNLLTFRRKANYKRCAYYFYRTSTNKKRNSYENDLKRVKEVKCVVLLNKPLFPGLTYVLNSDKNVVKYLGVHNDYKEKKNIFVGLFFHKEKTIETHLETNNTFYNKNCNTYKPPDLLNEKRIKVDKNILKKDIDICTNINDIYSYGCVGVIKEILYDEDNLNSICDEKDYNNINESNDIMKKHHFNENNKKEKDNYLLKNHIDMTNMNRSNDLLIHNKLKEKNNENLNLNMHKSIYRIVVETMAKIKIEKWNEVEKVGYIDIIRNEDYDINNKEIKIYYLEIIDKIKKIICMNSCNNREYNILLKYYNTKNLYNLIYFVGNISLSKNNIIQNLLERNILKDQLKICIQILCDDIYLLEMKQKLNEQINEKFENDKKNMIIKEQINILKKQQQLLLQTQRQEQNMEEYEDGNNTIKYDHDLLCDEFRNKLMLIRTYISDEAYRIINQDINKFMLYNENSNEYSSTYQYLSTSLNIPFNKYKMLNDNIFLCEQILNKNHYGLKNVKKYILEYLALYILNKNIKSKILLLVGSPGTGKTSICKSISECLNIPYYIINMNNIHNMNELIGHRKTYVNSYQGQIINSLIATKIMNPIVILDEFDKVAFINTNIYNMFLNIFDKEQNEHFKDQYINFEVDISKIFFICTANSVENIPDVLLDRVEIIHIHAYTNMEKIDIYKNYLKHKIENETKITSLYLNISNDVLLYILDNYTQENGLRQFYNILYNIYKKRAYMLIKGYNKKVDINLSNISEFVGADQLIVKKNYHNNVHININKENIMMGNDKSEKYERNERNEKNEKNERNEKNEKNDKSEKNEKYEKNKNYEKTCGGSVKSLAFTENGGQVIIIEVSSLSDKIKSHNYYNYFPLYYNDDYMISTHEEKLKDNKTEKYNELSKKNNKILEGENRWELLNNIEMVHPINELFSISNKSYKNIYNMNYEEDDKKSLTSSFFITEDGYVKEKERAQQVSFMNNQQVLNSYNEKNKNIYNHDNIVQNNSNKYIKKENKIYTYNNSPYELHPIHNNNNNNNNNNNKNNLNHNITITGNVGRIMQESILIAYTYSMKLLNTIMLKFESKPLHINLSDGDLKKDGPSAGINFVTCILSYYLNIPVDNTLCMTGEINLNGYVLKIGGLYEKLNVARNFGIRTLIIPKENSNEYQSLPQHVKQNIRVLYVHHYSQIFNFIFNNKK
ncbi:ATP-dependent protease La [Plasmodium falciparum UGT5.1]|uniref:ATP-dependent protease La n=1 Tax=Plasmodium falciparum UGT5.1 TaxID=1237627 RepID=W7JHC3_PLAFA|nr:ATP-dependent protease La [Plasmodium falciparum UGT5.1]